MDRIPTIVRGVDFGLQPHLNQNPITPLDFEHDYFSCPAAAMFLINNLNIFLSNKLDL